MQIEWHMWARGILKNITLQNRSSCMHLKEIIFNIYTKQILSETNNPSKIIWTKQSIGKYLSSIINDNSIGNAACTPNSVHKKIMYTGPWYLKQIFHYKIGPHACIWMKWSATIIQNKYLKHIIHLRYLKQTIHQ